mmetsp:Transcript_48063/g.108925  ORF Transcript_48063/g.108925 Transcript_48063/m.108925 type:complete len:424 (+) Transcript_48063:80-1351(+)
MSGEESPAPPSPTKTTRHGLVTVYSRDRLQEISRAAVSEQLVLDLDPPDHHGEVTSATSEVGVRRVASLPTLRGGTAAKNREKQLQMKRDGTERRRRDMQEKLQVQRDGDMGTIRERVQRHQQLREQRFERLQEEILGQSELRCMASETLRAKAQDDYRRRSQMYEQWNEKVYNNIQKQITRALNPNSREKGQMMGGSKSVGFQLPDENFKPRIHPADDPTKSSLYASADEKAFQLTAEGVSYGMEAPTLPNGETNFSASHGGVLSFKNQRVGRSRPVLEPEMWEQHKFQGTPFGHFAQVAELGPGEVHTLLKVRNFMPPEHDGVNVAGKRCTRYSKTDLGVLQGDGEIIRRNGIRTIRGPDVAQRGESSLWKSNYGSSCGAPCQDHFAFSTGVGVVDAEYPLGKRMRNPPPGTIPRELGLHC